MAQAQLALKSSSVASGKFFL
jgi:Ca2+-binding EF-hand superfamily protein